MKLRIADYNILLNNCPVDIGNDIFKIYSFEFANNNADLTYNISIYKGKYTYKGKLIHSKNNKSIYKYNNEYVFEYILPHINGNGVFYTIINFEEDDYKIILPDNYKYLFFSEELLFSLLALDFVLINKSAIFMHASVIEYDSEAILFTGASGIGKSTQADLWKKFECAYLINGDRALITTSDNNIFVHGSPYAGSSKIYTNKTSKIRAIILLEQGDDNYLEKLKGVDAYKKLYPRFALPTWDFIVMNKGVLLVDKVFECVPIYRYKCTNSQSSVEYLKKYLYK